MPSVNGAKTSSITTLSIMKLSIKTLNKKTPSMMKYRASWCYALFMLIVANKSLTLSVVMVIVFYAEWRGTL
jgi:hypothetical protein